MKVYELISKLAICGAGDEVEIVFSGEKTKLATQLGEDGDEYAGFAFKSYTMDFDEGKVWIYCSLGKE